MDSLRKNRLPAHRAGQVSPKLVKKLVARAVEKGPTAKIYFHRRLFLLLTCNIWCGEFSVRSER
jgi:hypothetical protein